MVSQSAIIGLVFQLALSVILPAAGYIYLRKKYKIAFRPVLVGILIFFVFANVLGGAFNQFILVANKATSQITENPILFAVYGGLSAGFFEEMGRFIAFAWLLKLYRERKDGLAYGVGHGGIEALLVGALGSIQLIVLSGLQNSGKLEETVSGQNLPPEVLDQLASALAGLTFPTAVMGGLERVAAFFLQIALSLLVLYAVKNKKYLYLLAAILLHALIDFFPGLYQAKVLNLYVTEIIIYLIGIGAWFFIKRSSRMKGLDG
ncbi:YhfC family intramembrane metalloprotease [Bacillus sp. FJAT-42376]|uniref:YhfC family intramembrane metalloprotease n=1 Tax=Bacillus sp. FJAT-42376 TaxID=2014076 RepID=UPI000F4E8F92|nr:YhfC family intramembrane metalloprotease [Bacillus sp. FJAT-42376]AZB41607.1 YhfC family intramembrane metalloprotease [Bacillus sp. FJAT-42376]